MWGRKEYGSLGFDDTTASVLDVDRVQEVIRRRASRFKVRVNWVANAHTAVTRNLPHDTAYDYEIDIPAIRQPVTKEQLIRTYMYVVHECGHLMRPEVWDIAIAAQPNATLQAIFNIVEDDGMERDVASRALGDARTLGEGNAIMCKDGEIYWAEQVAEAKAKGVPFTEESLKPMITMAIQLLSRKEWDGWSRDAIDDWLKVMPDEGRDLMVALVKEGWVDRLRATKTPFDSWDVSCDLYDRLYPTEDEDEQEQRAKTRANGADPENAEPQEQQADGEGDGERTTGEEKVDDEGYVISWTEVGMSEHGTKEGQPHGNGGPAGITWQGAETKGNIGFMPHDMVAVQPLWQTGYVLSDRYGGSCGRRAQAPGKFMPTSRDSAVLANKTRRFVQSQTRARIDGEKEHGKLNNQELARLLMPPVDGGNWNKRVFYDLARKRAINTAIHILVDWSGSMMGGKARYAGQAAIQAATVFGTVLRMPVAVTAFTCYENECDMGIIKPYDRHVTQESMATSFADYTKWHGGNNDGDAVMWSYRELMKRKEPRKMLIVMSDGAPADAYIGNAHENILAATRQIQDEGHVELFGLGLKSDAVSNYYDNWEIINSSQDINEALLTVLARSIRYE